MVYSSELVNILCTVMPPAHVYSFLEAVTNGLATTVDATKYIHRYGYTSDAIQAAVDEAQGERVGYQTATLAYAISQPVVYMPFGIYTWTAPVRIRQNTRIVANQSLIAPVFGWDSDDYAFQATDAASEEIAWRNLFQGLQFDNINGFDLFSNNLDSGEVTIRECRFYGKKAIKLSCQSTRTVIDECNFDRCVEALRIVAGDRVTLRSSWITGAAATANQQASIYIQDTAANPLPEVESPVFFQAEDTTFIPGDPGSYEELAWIENSGGSVLIEKSKIGGEFGGISAINNKRRARIASPVIGSSLTLKNNWLFCEKAGAGSVACAVRLFEVPNNIRLLDNEGFYACSGIAFSKTVTPATKVGQADDGTWGTPGIHIRNRIYGNQWVQSWAAVPTPADPDHPFHPVEIDDYTDTDIPIVE